MITHQEYQTALKTIIEYRNQCVDAIDIIEKVTAINESQLMIQKTKLIDSGLSVRAINGFKYRSLIDKDLQDILVIDLATISYYDLRRTRNIGNRSLNEIKELCKSAGINLIH